jgi:hypothetical protein
MFIPLAIACCYAESLPHPHFKELGIAQERQYRNPGGNMEGKEMRNGISGSAIWAVATTATSNGSVNSMHDSYTPIGGLILLTLMKIGEVVYGGVGSGLYGMQAYIFVAVFVAGLMVGRTPEYLGKKVEAYEVKMASLVLLIPIMAVLAGTATAFIVLPSNAGAINVGPHAFTEVLYAFTSWQRLRRTGWQHSFLQSSPWNMHVHRPVHSGHMHVGDGRFIGGQKDHPDKFGKLAYLYSPLCFLADSGHLDCWRVSFPPGTGLRTDC